MTQSAGRSRNARLNQAVNHAQELLVCLDRLSGRPRSEVVDAEETWASARDELNQLVQCFHEANAYNNAVGDKP